MKIGFTGMDLPEGKRKYQDENLVALEKKDKPKKVVPFYAEFSRDEFVQAEVIVIPEDKILDLLILDMELAEARLSRLADDEEEKALLAKCTEILEKGTPLCEVKFNDEEKKRLQSTQFHSLKPVVKVKDGVDVNEIISLALEKSDYMFFYTSGPDESRAWLVKKNSDIVTCAGKIHSDLARGFIKGDVVRFEEYMSCHSYNECRSKGISRLVDRDYIVQPREVIEIRFNV